MPIDPAEFLKELQAINTQLTAVNSNMNKLNSGFEPPPDPDKPGLLAQLNTIKTSCASITTTANTLIAKINAS
jgi:hypothetical protein